MVSSSIRLTAWLQKFKEAGGTVREIDVWAESPRLSPLWLSASSSACHGLLIITVITPLPTKLSATKMPEENWSWRTRQLLTCRCVSVMLPPSGCKYTKELAMLKLKNDALRDMLLLAASLVAEYQRRRPVSQCIPPPPAWIMQPLWMAEYTAEWDYFTLKESWSLKAAQKQLEGTQKFINELVQMRPLIMSGNS